MVSAWLTRRPVRIYHIHGLPYMAAAGKRRRLLKATEWVSCRLATRVFCVSHSIRDVAVREGVCEPAKIVVFCSGSVNGVDAAGRFNPHRFGAQERRKRRDALGIRDEARVIGYVGRIVRDKGIEDLALAWERLRHDHPTAHLVLAGPRESQDPVGAEAIGRLERDPRVHLLGSIDDPSEVYSLFDIVVLPSYREGFPTVLLEAAAMALPVVASRIPGCTDAVLDGKTGTLFTPRDVGELTEAIGQYMENAELTRAHGRQARERVLREFRQEAVWTAVRDEYSRLLEKAGITNDA